MELTERLIQAGIAQDEESAQREIQNTYEAFLRHHPYGDAADQACFRYERWGFEYDEDISDPLYDGTPFGAPSCP